VEASKIDSPGCQWGGGNGGIRLEFSSNLENSGEEVKMVRVGRNVRNNLTRKARRGTRAELIKRGRDGKEKVISLTLWTRWRHKGGIYQGSVMAIKQQRGGGKGKSRSQTPAQGKATGGHCLSLTH